MLNRYFLIYLLTIVVTRVWLWLVPKHAPRIGGFQVHHYMYGLVLIVLFVLFAKPTLLAFGAALVVDELPMFFIFKSWNWPDNHWAQYQSWQSLLGVIMISLLGYIAIRFLPAAFSA